MSLPNVNIILENGSLGGLVSTPDGVVGLIGTGTATSGLLIGEPTFIFSLTELEQKGVTSVNNPQLYRHVSEFYREANGVAPLFIMIVPDTMTQTQMWDTQNPNGIIKLLNFANGSITVAASFFDAPISYTPVLTSGLDGDVYTAIPKAQEMSIAMAAQQRPIRCVIEGRGFTGNAALLTDLKTLSANRVAVVVASSFNDSTASVGMVLGRLATIPVQRKISRVKSGPLSAEQMFVGQDDVTDFSGLSLMHSKGYIVAREFSGVGGLFFSGDPTCTSNTDDYNTLSRGRVIDKAQRIAYATYVEEIDDEVEFLPDGKLEPGVVFFLENKITTQLVGSMQSQGNVSSVSAFINPNQNVIVQNKLTVVLRLQPVGYKSIIEVSLGFALTT